jgi:hypothetical protein
MFLDYLTGLLCSLSLDPDLCRDWRRPLGMTLTIDSGKKQCGWTLGEKGEIYRAGLWRLPGQRYGDGNPPIGCEIVDLVLVEVPHEHGIAPTPDLIDITARGCWLAGRMAPHAEFRTVRPRDWKGTVDGDVFLRRIEKHLRPHELTMIKGVDCPESLRHNIMDAAGLFLWSVGRL